MLSGLFVCDVFNDILITIVKVVYTTPTEVKTSGNVKFTFA